MRRLAFGVVCDGLDGSRFGGCLQRNALFLSSGRRVTPVYRPQKKNMAPAPLGPGSRSTVSEMAPNWLLDHPLEAMTDSKWLEMLPRWFRHRFEGQLDPTWGHLGPLLGVPEAQNAIRIKVF